MQQNIPRQGESHKRTYTHMLERRYQAFSTVKPVGACICSPSSVIAAACGRVKTAQPPALPFDSSACNSCPLLSFYSPSFGLLEFLELCPAAPASVPSYSLWARLCTSHGGRCFLINIHSPPPQPTVSV